MEYKHMKIYSVSSIIQKVSTNNGPFLASQVTVHTDAVFGVPLDCIL